MPTHRPTTPLVRFSESPGTLDRVEIFAAGNHRGKVYTTRDLDDMVDAFRRYSRPQGSKGAPLVVPAVIGHDEAAEQTLLQQTGLPAAAWCTDLWREGDVLCARLDDLAPEVARLIAARRYRRVSAEIYDRHPAGLPTAGLAKRMLRRIAFLGGEIPQVKTLADIPIPHSESWSGSAARRITRLRAVEVIRRPRAESFLVFSEVVPMDKDALLAQLQKLGTDTSALAACDEGALSEMVRVLTDAKGGQQAAQQADATTPDQVASTPDATNPSTPADAATPASTETATPPVEKQGDMTITHDGGNTNVQATGGDDAPPPPGSPPEKMAAYHKSMCDKYTAQCQKYSEDPRFREIDERLARADQMARQRETAERKAMVTSRLNACVQSGRVLPAERDAGLDDALLAIPTDAVAKFSEGGKVVEVPVLDRILTALEARPVIVKFGERVAGPAPKKAGSEDAEIAKIEERYEQFSEEFERAGLTKEKLIDGFKAERKVHPKRTAEEYLNT